MSGLATLATIGVLAILILVHELGHFTAARAQGIHVNRFSIGFGPILWKYQGPETEYALRGIPLGGFVGFPDDDPDSEIPPNDPNLLRNRPVLDRAIVISAGVIANLIFAYLVLVLQTGFVGIPEASQPGVLIPQLASQVSQVSPAAAELGFKPGDTVFIDGQHLRLSGDGAVAPELVATAPGQPLKVLIKRGQEAVTLDLDGAAVREGKLGVTLVPSVVSRAGIQPGDVVLQAGDRQFSQALTEETALRELIRASAGKPLPLLVKRQDQELSLTVVPEPAADGTGRIGVQLLPNGKTVYRHSANFGEVFGLAAEQFQQITVRTAEGFGQLFTNFKETVGQVSGPVAIVEQGAKFAQADPANLLVFAAVISINLAIINILPLPALDGGQLAFLLIEGLFGKPLPTKFQEGVMQTGLVLLLGLGIFLIIRDTTQLEGIQRLLR